MIQQIAKRPKQVLNIKNNYYSFLDILHNVEL